MKVKLNSDFRDFLTSLNLIEIKYLVVEIRADGPPPESPKKA